MSQKSAEINALPRRATLRDVARQVQLSVTAVSLGLSGHPSIPNATRARIQAAADGLAYRPNSAARALRTQRHAAIALVVLGPDSDEVPAHYSDLSGAVAEEARHQDHRLLLLHTSAHTIPERRLDVLLANAPVDGAVCIGTEADGVALSALQHRRFPFLFVGKRYVPGVAIPYVATDYVAAGRLATDHLWQLGHRRIAAAVDPAHRSQPWVADRLTGHSLALQERGVTVGPHLVLELAADDANPSGALAGGWPESGTGWNSAAWRDGGITAIFAVEHTIAYRLLRYLHVQGVAVPQEMAIVGFDDMPGSDLLLPPLTTIRQPLPALGALAARTLLAWISGGPHEPRVATLPAELVVRASCGAGDR